MAVIALSIPSFSLRLFDLLFLVHSLSVVILLVIVYPQVTMRRRCIGHDSVLCSHTSKEPAVMDRQDIAIRGQKKSNKIEVGHSHT